MKNIMSLIVLLPLSLSVVAGVAQAEDLYFEAEDMSLIKKMYEGDMWPIPGGRALYIHPHWGRMPLRYTLKAVPNKTYDVIFYTSDVDPGVANLDISWDNAKTWDTSYRNVKGEGTVKQKVTADGKGNISFIIAHVVGVNSSLDYIKLLDLSPRGKGTTESLVSWVSKGTQPSVQKIIQRLIDNPDALRIQWRPKGISSWTGQTAKWKLGAKKGILIATAKGDKLFSVSASASDYEGAVRLTVRATSRGTKENPYELMLTSAFNPGNWQRQFYPQMPYLVLKPGRRTITNFSVDAEDATTLKSKAFYPFGVLEKENGFLLWGAMDVGKFRSLTPNMVPKSIPSFAYEPLSLRKGKTFTFDVTLKWFGKPEFKYRDVLRWYLCSLENSDPLTKDWVGRWDGKPFVRPLAEGKLDAGGTPGQMYTKASEKNMRSSNIGNIWFMYFRPSGAPCSIDKTWKNMWWRDASREDMLAQISWLKAKGFHPFLYQNQFLGCEEDLTNNPSLRKWIAYQKDGKTPYPVYAFHGCVGPIKTRMYYFADFGNDEYRAWYINKVKEAVNFYRPEGLAWDCGFGHYHAGYSASNPNTTNGHGILRVQAEMWKWIHEKYPNMRVLVNECMGSFSQLVTDAVIIENVYGGGKKKLDFEAAKVTGATIIAGEYRRDGEFQFRGVPTATYPYLAMRYRAKGLNTKSQDAVVTTGANPWTTAWPTIKGSDLQADGQWHTVVVDLKKRVPSLNEVKTLTVNLSPNKVGVASLDIDFLRFSKDSTGAKAKDIRDKTNPLSHRSFLPVELDANHFDLWTPVPTGPYRSGAAASDFGLQIKDGTTQFSVKGTGRKIRWVTLPPKFTANMMRVMSYGASLGFGNIKYWPEISEFSAKAMATPLLVGSHDVKVDNKPAKLEDKVTASAWAGGGRLLLAAYNDGKDQALSTIRVAPEVLKTAGVRKIKSSTIRILGGNGCLLKKQNADVRLTKEGGLQVKVKLEPGHALLLRVNDDVDSSKAKDG